MTLPPRWRKVFSDLTSHKSRTALVVLSIAVGVFAIAVVMGGRGVLLREFDEDFAASRPPDAEFATSDFGQGQLHEVERQPYIAYAEARRRVSLRFTTSATPGDSTAGWSSIQLWALPSFSNMQVSRISAEKGAEWPPPTGTIILERSALQAADYKVNDVITVETSTGKRAQLRIGGFAHDINAFPTTFTGTVIGYVSMGTLAQIDEPEDFNSLSVVFSAAGLTRTEASRLAVDLRDDVLAPAGVQVYNMQVPKPGSHFLGDIFKAVSLLLLALGVLSLALSAFLVINTVSAIMAQQVRQVGIMKSVGGRSRQIMTMYLALVGIFGFIAVAVGLPIGSTAGRWFIEYAANVLNFRVTSFVPPAYVIALEIGVGLMVPLLAALVPVRLGSRVTVVKALNASGISTATFGHSLIDRILGLVRGLPRPIALSLRNTFLRKGRLVLTLFTLTLASAVVMATLSVRGSILQTITDIGAWWNYDAQVSFARPKPAQELERIAKEVPGVTALETWAQAGVSYKRDDGSENEAISAIGLPPQTRFITPKLVTGRWLERADTNAIVINTDVYKDESRMRVGNTVRLTIMGHEGDYKVVGVVTGQLMGSTIFMDKTYLDSVMQTAGGVTRLLVMTGSHTDAAQQTAAAELERRLDDAGMPATGSETQIAMRQRLGNELNILVTFLVIMAALLAAVGIIGLAGTMTINVLESVREIGVMRAIGASHGSIFGIYITEGMVVGLMAWALGAVGSWPISLLLTNALSGAMNIPLSYRFSFFGVGAWLVSVLAIAVVASLLPSWRASQVSVRDAIAYE
jgi:putative ABC transport system permease protein